MKREDLMRTTSLVDFAEMVIDRELQPYQRDIIRRLTVNVPPRYAMSYYALEGATLFGPKVDRAMRQSFAQTKELRGASADLVLIDDLDSYHKLPVYLGIDVAARTGFAALTGDGRLVTREEFYRGHHEHKSARRP